MKIASGPKAELILLPDPGLTILPTWALHYAADALAGALEDGYYREDTDDRLNDTCMLRDIVRELLLRACGGC